MLVAPSYRILPVAELARAHAAGAANDVFVPDDLVEEFAAALSEENAPVDVEPARPLTGLQVWANGDVQFSLVHGSGVDWWADLDRRLIERLVAAGQQLACADDGAPA